MKLNIDLSKVQTKSRPLGQKRVLLQHKEKNDYILQIDNSSLESFNYCPRNSEYSLVHGRVLPAVSALVYGSAIHNGLEYWYKTVDLDMEHEDRVQRMLTCASETFQQESYIPQMSEWRTIDRCHDTLLRYVKHYDGEDLKVLSHNGRPAVETAFSLPMGVLEVESDVELDGNVFRVDNIHVYWTGKIDLLVAQDNKRWIVDHKTTSMTGPTFYEHFMLSGQMLGYTWAAQEIFGEKPLGAMVNVIYGRPVTRTGTHTKFERERFPYRQDQIDEWKENTFTLVGDFVSNLIRNNFPMATSNCMGKYGKCKYHDVCTLPANQRMSMLNSDQFSDNTWSPLNKN